MVSRDKTEPGPLFLKELSNYTVRHVNTVCVHILRSIHAIMINVMPIVFILDTLLPIKNSLIFLKELSNYTVRHVNAVCVYFLT